MGGGSWAWPDVDTLEGAEDAAHKAAYFAWVVAGLTVLSILLFMLSGATLPTIAIIITLFLAVAYALIGWQVYELSSGFAVLGLILYAVDLVAGFAYIGFSVFGAIRIVFLIGFINGVRGTFAHQRLTLQISAGDGSQKA
jgi:hypothetical protein